MNSKINVKNGAPLFYLWVAWKRAAVHKVCFDVTRHPIPGYKTAFVLPVINLDSDKPDAPKIGLRSSA